VQLPDVRVNGIFNLQFSPDNRFVAHDFRGDSGRLRPVEVNTAEECLRLQTRHGHERRVDDIAFSDDGSVLAVGGGDLYFWSVDTGERLAFRPSIYGGWLNWLPDGILTSSRNVHASSLFFWPTAHHHPAHWKVMHPRALLPLKRLAQHQVSASGRIIVAAAIDHVVVAQWQGHDQVGVLPEEARVRLALPAGAPRGDVYTVAISPDERWIAAGLYKGNAVVVWERLSGRCIKTLDAGIGNAIFVGFSPDSETLVTGGEDQYQFFSTDDWKLRQRRQRNGGTALADFTRDGRYLAASDSSSVLLILETDSLKEVAKLELPEGGLLSDIAFGPTGDHLAASTENQTTYLWNLRKIHQELEQHGLNWQSRLPEPHRSSLVSEAANVAEADALPDASDGGQFATLPPPPPLHARLDQARKLCAEERWDEAVRLLNEIEVFSVEHRGSTSFKVSRFRPPAILATSQQWPAYHEHCRRLLAEFRDEQDASFLEQIAKACLFAKPEPDNRHAACAIAERAYQLAPNAWTHTAMAFAKLRQNQLDESRKHCEEALTLAEHHRFWYLHTESQLILALIAAKQERFDEAKARKQEALQQLSEVDVVMTTTLHDRGYPDWLICRHLLRELDALLAQQSEGKTNHDAETTL
jgi:WD40 repeat protein